MSSAYFVDRVRRYLSEALNMPWEDTKLETFMTHLGCASSFYSPSLTESSSLHPERLLDVTENPMNLTRAQEESFLNLFWQSFHCMYPILSEPDFREYYGSLWADTMLGGSTARRPSPLVDVLLAVCMQYGSTFLFSDGSGGNTSNLGYARTPGYEFYQRSQRTLQRYLETPSIMVLQSHIYCIIYLCNISHFNAAHMNLGMTLRIAHALRLHLQPLENISAQKQELHRRIWWTLFCLDSQLSMTLGRASFIHPSQVSCGLPGDDLGPIRSSGSMLLSSHEDISWLSFHIQCIKITAAVQSIHATFKQKCSELLRDGPQDIYETPCIIEALADCLAREMGSVHEWVRNVPQSLRLSRQGLGTGEPFSTNKAPLNLDLSSPLWLQRQRLLLELFYHHLQLSIFRPFLRFPPVGASQTPLADNYGISCVNHATVITSIIHQVLTTTDLLHGWPSILQTQWDAILCTLGFILGNPVCSPTPFARKSLQIAVQTLELVADYSPIAKSAAQVTRAMDQHADTLITNFRQSLVPREAQRSTYSPSLATQNPLPRGTQNPLENTTQAASLTTTGVLTLSTGNFEPVLATNGSMEAVGAQDGILATAWNELSSNLALNDPPSAAPSSIDMLNSSEMHWIHANGMSLDSWNELAVIP
ncbi:fungal-specific transcription factor domain-containing protein [Aspergillus californicus]